MYCLLLRISYLQRFWTSSWTLILVSFFISLRLFRFIWRSLCLSFLLFRFDEKQAKNSILFASQPHDFCLDFSCFASNWKRQRKLELCSRYLLQTTEKRSNYCLSPDNSLTNFPPCFSQSRRLYSFALIFLFLQTHATSFSFYISVTVHWKKERMYILHAFTNSINTTAST